MIELASNAVHVWHYQIKADQREKHLANYQDILPANEIAKSNRYKFQHLRENALTRRLLVRTILSKYTHTPPKDWVFKEQKNGKPEISSPDTDLRFNLSYSKDQVVCAITRAKDIGVDIENIDTDIDFTGVAEGNFSSTEINKLAALIDPELKRQYFYDIWTLKESFVKALGTGLFQPLDQFSFTPPLPSRPKISDCKSIAFENRLNQAREMWQFWLIDHVDNFQIAVSLNASQKTAYQLHFKELSPSSLGALPCQ